MENLKNEDFMTTDQAWHKLKEKLTKGHRSVRWDEWVKESIVSYTCKDRANIDCLTSTASTSYRQEIEGSSELSSVKPVSRSKRRIFSWIHCHTKWLSAVAAASVLAIVITTPAGDKVLASILNQFRMQEITVVEQKDLENIFHAFKDGLTRESINRLGTFTQKSGKHTDKGNLTVDVANNMVDGKLILPEMRNEGKDSIEFIDSSPDATLTLQMNVDEVNRILKRLGAKKMLPASVDGKPIRLHIGNEIQMRMRVNAGTPHKKAYYLRQIPVPELTIDPSIPLSEAVEALVQFPLMPDHLKKKLKFMDLTGKGPIPLPYVADGNVEIEKVDGVQVIVEQKNYVENDLHHGATWVQNGMLVELYGNITKQELLQMVKEVIHS